MRTDFEDFVLVLGILRDKMDAMGLDLKHAELRLSEPDAFRLESEMKLLGMMRDTPLRRWLTRNLWH